MKILHDFEIDEILNQLNLDLLERHYPHWNFRCPICGDSKKSPYKKRGWIRQKTDNSGYYFICYNCGTVLSVPQFVKIVNEDIYKQYFKPSIDEIPKILSKKKQIKKKKSKSLILFSLSNNFYPITDREKEYLKYRCIPEKYWNLFRVYKKQDSYINNFLIIPFWYKDTGKVYGYQARNIEKKEFRTFIISKGYKIYNLFNIDSNKPVFIFEAVFDSMMVNNSIATLGATFSHKLIDKFIPKENQIYVFDNDKTGYERTIEFLKLGYKCVVYPKDFYYKDINDAVRDKVFSIQEIEKFLLSHIGNKDDILDLKLRLELGNANL